MEFFQFNIMIGIAGFDKYNVGAVFNLKFWLKDFVKL